ncbi:MAG: threonine--tRNA ligase [Acidobacteria bacterium]|nr:threonine--tRNA ligase [Acidobacteriota bacterium]MCA1610041.1 threonine--tRNA ligase [Acidobacteriota bacterium]
MEARADAVTITLPDGSTKSIPRGTTVRDVAAGIGPRLAKDAWAGKLDGKVVDLKTPVESDASLEIITGRSPDAVPIYRHSTAHLTAQAVKRLFPDVQIGIGPPIENGFYYDFNPKRAFTPEDLAAIEAEMRRIIAEDLPIERLDMPIEEAISIFEKQGDALKVEIARGIPDGERVSCYRQGEFVDLCRGPHVASTGRLGVFRLTHTAGAYWKGDEHNPMLQRIYGASFLTQKELDAFLAKLEEGRARDHRKLGKELDLFSFDPLAPASPFFHPKGAAVYTQLLDYLRAEYRLRGYDEVITPQIFDSELFKISGHYDNYKENMYFASIDEREFGVKPMNCPGHYLMFREKHWSYRDLPVRWADFGRLHRYERSGVTAGLTRVRTFSQDDAHIFAPLDKLEDEIFRFLDFIDSVYGHFGFDEVEISLGLRPEKRIGSDEIWDRGEASLDAALRKAGRKFVVTPNDGAFYGPKIDFRVQDAIGRGWQLGTIQCDFSQAERFDLSYIGEDGGRHRPVVLHRAILGSLERFLAILIEHTAGNFPFWIAPVHAVVLPVSDKFSEATRAAAARLKALGLRVELDDRNEKLGARIRKAEMQKVPCMLVVGEKEASAGTVSVRLRHGGDAGTMTLDEFASAAGRAIAEKKKELGAFAEVKDR